MTDFINGIKKSLKEHNIDFRYYNDKRKNGRRIKISFVTEIEGKQTPADKTQLIASLDRIMDLCYKTGVMNVARKRYTSWRTFHHYWGKLLIHYEDYLFYLDK